MAAKFQFEDQHDPSSARSTMQRGLRSNPSSTHLWLEVPQSHCASVFSVPLSLVCVPAVLSHGTDACGQGMNIVYKDLLKMAHM